ncbi:acetylcholine receptor subunit alpha-like [Mercenaria mercenaria]|uniref:acetylcholine receptor subunit alpha-like n=1 Tax=Mercenaria mercenaria TaxID=6596 RepID=UPI00234E948C|nr:acetylcholine receptor subunit alpha-like [Mercenaria mercenaria]
MNVCSIILLTITVLVAKGKFNTTDLHEKIFKGYNKDAIPRRNVTEAVNVNLSLVLYSIHDVNEKYQTISFRAVLDIQWKDEFLTWNPDHYGDVKSITVPSEKIWIPDIVLQDTVGYITDSIKKDGRAMINHNGRVTIWPNDLYTVACKLSIKKFPFDKQTCLLDFLSWTSPSSVIQLENSDTNWIPQDHDILEKGEWYLQNVRIINQSKIFNREDWAHVIFIFEIQRKSLFHIVNSLIPVILISILDVMCFVLPSESGERVGLSISIFLTLTIFLYAVNSTLPESSDEVAVFTIFIGFQILGSALSVVMTNISLYFYFKNAQDPIPFLLWYFAKVFCMKKNTTKNTKVTWHMVSRASDRLCLLSAVIWHPVLIASLFIAAYQ